MDALLFALLVVVSCAIGWAIRILASDRPILGDLFRYQSPGWPSGVQEDDDLHWRWRPPTTQGLRTERLRAHVGPAGPIDGPRPRRR
jgi:hypothetical protein